MPRFIFLNSKPRPPGWVMTFYGVPFPDKAVVELTDPEAIAKARGNRFFLEVEVGEVSDPPEVKKPRGRPRKEA